MILLPLLCLVGVALFMSIIYLDNVWLIIAHAALAVCIGGAIFIDAVSRLR